MEEQKVLKKRVKQAIWLLIFSLSLGVFIYSGHHLLSHHLSRQEARNEHEKIMNIAYSMEQESTNPINFEELVIINEDIVGWIVVEGTNINYPIVQGEDNEKYLHTTFFGTNNPSGAIFMDKRNTSDFSDPHTFIYGHHMRNGTMFAALTKFQEQSFFDNYSIFTIYTPEGEKRYEIFSAYLVSAYGDTYLKAFATGETFDVYLQYITGLSEINTGITPSNTDRIVTLSTCEYQFEDARMVVHGRLVEVENIGY